MCGPAAPILAAAAALTAATGQVMSGIGKGQQFRYQASVDQQNARLANEQARDSIENTNLEAQRRSRILSQTKGEQRAAMAANGIDLEYGSAVDIAKDTAMIGVEDMSQIAKAGFERTRGFEINAFNYRSSAAANRAKAKGAVIEGVIGAFSSALGGASQISAMNSGPWSPSRGRNAYGISGAGQIY